MDRSSAVFSQRIGWPTRGNRLSQVLQEKRLCNRPIIDLTESNPTQAGFVYPREAILSALSQPEAMVYDPQSCGSGAARQAVADYYGQRGLKIHYHQVVLTCSTSEAYTHLFRLLGDAGDHFLVPRPSYPLFEYLAGLESVRLHPYRLFYDRGWYIDFQSLEDALAPDTRAILLVNPNNPTGAFVKRPELDRLLALCRERHLPLIVDEVFSDYVLCPEPGLVQSLAGETEALTFVMSGLSKVSGLPQMKLGWIVVSGPGDLRENALEKLELIADTFLSASTPVQLAAAGFMDVRHNIQPQILERLRRNLDALERELKETAAQPLHVDGGWYAVVQLPRVRTEEEWVVGLLEHHDVLLHPGYFYDFPTDAFAVFSLLTPIQMFDEGLRRFKSFLFCSEASPR